MKTGVVIVAGGSGQRAGGELPKQFQNLGEKPVLSWSVDRFSQHTLVDETVLVLPADFIDEYPGLLPDAVQLIQGGDTRAQSVLNGLEALSLAPDDIVLIHDAARPGISDEIISALIEALDRADAAAPALPVTDALKRQDGGRLNTVRRDDLFRVQTPQAFRYGTISKALSEAGTALVDDLSAIEARYGKVELIPGSERLSKITYPGDLERMELLLSLGMKTPRVGSGFDVHAFGAGDYVTLCGVKIAHSKGLEGHSDADVAWHALTDAILGAAALGDIGDHFPPSNPKWKGAASELFLSHAVELARQSGFKIASCDITLICEAPKVKPHREAMREATAAVLNLPLDCISIKATTTEQLGFTGRGEGIAAQAVAVLSPAS